MKILLASFLLLISLFYGCSKQKPKSLRISVNAWIGFSPLFYAKEKGWLEPLNIDILPVTSLRENVHIYLAGVTDAFPGTQFEYKQVLKEIATLIPIIAFDRSLGGDMIMSNDSIEKLQSSKKNIDTYLEMDTINYEILNDFIAKYNILRSRISFIDKNQAEIPSHIEMIEDNPTLVVTYTPYNIALNRLGFKEIASTKKGLDLLVIDALYTTRKIFKENTKRFKDLKKLIDRAIVDLKKNPYEYYQIVAPYLEDISYKDFQEILLDIEWINHDISTELQQRMEKADIPIKDIIW